MNPPTSATTSLIQVPGAPQLYPLAPAPNFSLCYPSSMHLGHIRHSQFLQNWGSLTSPQCGSCECGLCGLPSLVSGCPTPGALGTGCGAVRAFAVCGHRVAHCAPGGVGAPICWGSGRSHPPPETRASHLETGWCTCLSADVGAWSPELAGALPVHWVLLTCCEAPSRCRIPTRSPGPCLPAWKPGDQGEWCDRVKVGSHHVDHTRCWDPGSRGAPAGCSRRWAPPASMTSGTRKAGGSLGGLATQAFA